jgi:hypothetical protein
MAEKMDEGRGGNALITRFCAGNAQKERKEEKVKYSREIVDCR